MEIPQLLWAPAWVFDLPYGEKLEFSMSQHVFFLLHSSNKSLPLSPVHSSIKYIVEDLKTGGREDLKRGDSDPRNHIKFSHRLARILKLLSVGRQSLERCGNKMTFHVKDLIYSSLAHLQIKCFVSVLCFFWLKTDFGETNSMTSELWFFDTVFKWRIGYLNILSTGWFGILQKCGREEKTTERLDVK